MNATYTNRDLPLKLTIMAHKCLLDFKGSKLKKRAALKCWKNLQSYLGKFFTETLE